MAEQNNQILSFSNDGEGAIQRQRELHQTLLPSVDEIDNYFELPRCVNWITTNNYSKVCLQFPDVLLRYAIEVSKRLENLSGRRMHVLADSTYGSCCVDEKTAKHVGGDSIIHFGLSCLSASQRIPVLYIFTQPKIRNLRNGLDIFKTHCVVENPVVILFDVCYETLAQNIFDEVKTYQPTPILSQIVLPGSTKLPNQLVVHGRFLPDVENAEDVKTVFYIGSNQRTLLNFVIQLPSAQFLIYDPVRDTHEWFVNEMMKLVMRRNYYVERLKDASTVGILVGTLAVENFLNIISQLKEILTKANKRYYVVSIGEITPPKLANFSDIEVFVLVACPESTLLDSKDFFQPILTPYEVELAFNLSRQWSGDYLLDFRLLLPGGQRYVAHDTVHTPDVSLITGGIRAMTNWKGLDTAELGQEEIIEGRSGIASHYEDEPIS